MTEWKTFVARCATAGVLVGGAMGVSVFVGIRLAAADPGGPTRDELTFSGVLRETDGSLANRPATLTFVFHKEGSTTTCSPMAMATAVNGAFTASVSTVMCGRGFFDGANVTYDVLEGATALVMGVNVTPVPYARFADQAGVNNDCPAGYVRDSSAGATPGIVCARTVTLGGVALRDEVVKVGVGGSAFWVDRYEASVHHGVSGAQLGTSNTTGGSADDIATSGLSRSGQRTAGSAPAIALSHPGQPTVSITWFQANEACAAAGKRLPQREEWFRAASGTVDGAMCHVSSTGARAAAPTNGCVSASGVHDMIGNVFEWTGEWYGGNGATVQVNPSLQNWPADYHMDATWNVNGAVNNGSTPLALGIPSAALRGGGWNHGAQAGAFALDLNYGPSSWHPSLGFRCVVPR